MKTIEISLKEIVISILYKWIPILLSALVIAALMGGYTYISLPQGDEYEEILAKYNQDLQTAKDEAQKQIADIEKNIEVVKDYISSNRSEGNMLKSGISYLSFRISVNPAIVDIYKVASEYIALYEKGSLKNVFKEVLPKEYDESFLRVLVALNEDNKGAFDPLDAGFMTIRAIGIDSVDPSVLARSLYNFFESNQKTVVSSAGVNTLSIVEQKKASSDDVNQKFNAILAVQRNLIAKYEAEIAGIRKGIAIMQRTSPSIIKKTMASFEIGAIIGALLGLIAAVMNYLYRLPVLIPEQPQLQLGIRYLGGLRRKRGILFSWLGDIFAGRFLLSDNLTDAVAYISANINEAVNENKKVLFTGTVPVLAINEFVQKLTEANKEQGTKYLVSDDVNKSADAVRKLSETDVVILVERLRFSTIRNISREQERIGVSGKTILGYILF